MESPKPKTSSQNEEKNMTSYEKVKNAKDTIHHHIDDLYPDAENQKREESHLSLELAGNKKQYEAIWNNLIAFFAQEKKLAEEKGDIPRLEELREKFESVKSAFKEILNASRELDTFGDIDGVQEAQDALEEKAEEIGNEITGEEEGTAKKYELNKKNEAIRKIEGNESAKKLLVLLEDEQIIDDASHVNVEKLIHRVLKEYSNIDEFEVDLMRVMNEKLSNEDKNEHRWDGFPLLVEELQTLYEAKNEEVNSIEEDGEEKEDNSKEEEGIEDRENPSEEEEVKDGEEKGDSETSVEDKNKEEEDSDKDKTKEEEKKKEREAKREKLISEAIEKIKANRFAMALLFLEENGHLPDRKGNEVDTLDVRENITKLLNTYLSLEELQLHFMNLVDHKINEIAPNDWIDEESKLHENILKGKRMLFKDEGVATIIDALRPFYKEPDNEKTKDPSKEKDDSGKEQKETRKGNIMTALERARWSAQSRKIDYIKDVITQFADRDRLMSKTSKGTYAKRFFRWLNARDNDQELHQKYLRALELAQRPTSELSDEERNFFISLDLRQFVNEKKLKKEGSIDSYSLTKESIRRLEDHLMNLESKITRDEVKDRNFLVKGFNEFRVLWRKFKVWHQNPENKRELRRRIQVSALSAIGTTLTGGLLAPALFGQIAAASFGSQAIRFVGSYIGGETFRKIYDATGGRDYREKFVKLRKWRTEQLKEARETIKDPELLKKRIDQIIQSYNGRRDELLLDNVKRAKTVRKQHVRRIWADRIGRIVGAFTAAGLEHYVQAHNVHEYVTPLHKEEIKPVPINQHPSPDLPSGAHEGFSPFKGDVIDQKLLTKDIFIKPGDGVTQIIQRQLHGNQELAKLFGIKDGSPLDYKHLAKAFGYMNEKGQVLLKLKPDHGYLATFIEAGGKKIPAIMEVDKAGNLFETHMLIDGKLTIIDHIKNIVSRVAETAKTVERSWEIFDPNHHISKVIEHAQNATDYGVNNHTVEVINNASQQVQDHTVEVLNGAQEVHKHTVEVLSQTPLKESVQTVSNGTISPVEISQHAETLPTGDYEPIPYHEHARRAVRELRRYLRRRGGFTLNLNIGGGFLGRLLGIGRSSYPHNLPRIPISTRGVGRVGRTIRAGVSAMRESNQ